MNPTVRILQKTDFTRENGTRNVFLRLTINRRVKYLALYVYVKPEHFKNGVVLKSDPDHKDKNLLIDLYLHRANKIILNNRMNNRSTSFVEFDQNFQNEKYGSQSFYDFIESQIKISKCSPPTIQNYYHQLNKMKEFRSEILFNDLEYSLIKKYDKFLATTRGNNKNTIIKSLSFLKFMTNEAHSQKIIKENPFEKYKLGRIEGDREFLNKNELIILHKLYNKGTLKANLANVLRYFLFSCYTGLRYQDVKNLKFNNISDNSLITLIMGKTKRKVYVPLINKAQELLPKSGFENQKVFNVLTDQPTNRYIKEIMKIAEINKHISFHCSRHTFATIAISEGMKYNTVSAILGHTDLKTTKIYGKYEIEFLTKEMNKLN